MCAPEHDPSGAPHHAQARRKRGTLVPYPSPLQVIDRTDVRPLAAAGIAA